MGRHAVQIFLPFFIVLVALGVSHAKGSEEIQKDVLNTIEIQKENQKTETAWHAEKSALVAEYERLLTVKKEKVKAKHEKEKALSLVKERVSAVERKIIETKRIKDELAVCLKTILNDLDTWIEKDLAFLPEERKKRITLIRDDLENSEVTPDEKFRIVFEALAVEAGYADTTEVYPETISIHDNPLHVDVLRLGRLALFFCTPDRERAGIYNRLDGQWTFLPETYVKRIGNAMEISAKRRIADFVNLPIGRIFVK